jgi:molecular chaperone DnaK (HSP70)
LPLQRIRVYDLGGGTLGVSLVDCSGDPIRVLGTDGDMALGGRDFDQRLLDRALQEYEKQNHRSLRSDHVKVAQVAIACERALIVLSGRLSLGLTVKGVLHVPLREVPDARR